MSPLPPHQHSDAHHIHTHHPAIIQRLRRAHGHLHTVISMIENDNRSCSDLAQQLHAVERAIGNAKRELIHQHLDQCLDEATATLPQPAQAAIDEFKHITKYL